MMVKESWKEVNFIRSIWKEGIRKIIFFLRKGKSEYFFWIEMNFKI